MSVGIEKRNNKCGHGGKQGRRISDAGGELQVLGMIPETVSL